MPNLSPTKIPMPQQAPTIRNKNFGEVELGYNQPMAREEAARCLQCKHQPCVGGCPVGVRIPEFIAKAAVGEFEAAYEIIKTTNALPAVCGRVCPQENQCESKCVRGIKGEAVAIGRLERFVSDYAMSHSEKTEGNSAPKTATGEKVAVIGSGPAGLACAGELANRGYAVTVFEASHAIGGVLVYGIPEFRLPKAIVAMEVESLKQQGVTIKTNMVAGKTFTLDELFEAGYEAVFIGSGAGLPNFMNIEGEGLLGVYSANEYLTRINLMKAYLEEYDTPLGKSNNVAIIGGGNVAMDAARCAKRLGAEHVYVVYRRSEIEMGARLEEIHHAKEEGIEFHLLTAPVQIVGDENRRVTGIECLEMTLGESDSSGRRRPVEIPNSHFVLEVDTVIVAIGTSPNPLITASAKDLATDKKGCIVADDEMRTSRKMVYAGGDAVTGAATVILAMGAGKIAAASIDVDLKNR